MSSIPLPALSIHGTQPQQNPLEQYGQLLQLKNAIANQPLQQQALQQQVQGGALDNQQKQIGLQQAQQGQQDQQAIRQLAMDPGNKGKTVGELADMALQSGKIAPQVYTQMKKADLEQRTSLEGLTKEQLSNADASHKQLQQIYDTAQDMTPEQLQQNWPAIAQQANAVHTNQPLHLDPSQPMTKEQLQQYGPMIAMQRTYLDEANAKAEKAATMKKTVAEASLAETNAAAGGTTDQAKTEHAYLLSHNLPDTPENRLKAFNYYNDKTKIAPAEVRAQIMLQTPTQVFNPETGQNVYATRKDAIGQVAPSSGEAIAAKAGVQADAASLKKLQTNFDQVSAFESTAGKNLDLFVNKLSKIPDLGGKFANVPMRLIDAKMIGTDNYQAMKAAQQTAAAEAAKVLGSANASGVLSDSQKKEAEDILSGNLTLSAAKAVVQTLRQDFANRHQSYKDQLDQIHGRLQGSQQVSSPSSNTDPFAQFGGKSH